jgi:signal transduction histidine kinase
MTTASSRPAESSPPGGDSTASLEGCRTETAAARAEATEARQELADSEARHQLALAAAHKDAALLHQRLAEQLERQIMERTEVIASANRELEAFAWSVSHDLRAPLRAVDGFSALLEEDASAMLDATARGYLGRIRAAAQRMAELIDDLLLLSRVTRADLTVTDIDLTRLAEEVIADLRAKPAAGRDHERSVEVTLQHGMHARGDIRLVRILLENLLANAWKFTRARTQAHISVEQAPDGSVRVLDDGVGFDEAQRHRLFIPFQRLHGPEPYEGSGIGLATVQRIALRHAGQVGAEIRPGGGAVFWFKLGTV